MDTQKEEGQMDTQSNGRATARDAELDAQEAELAAEVAWGAVARAAEVAWDAEAAEAAVRGAEIMWDTAATEAAERGVARKRFHALCAQREADEASACETRGDGAGTEVRRRRAEAHARLAGAVAGGFNDGEDEAATAARERVADAGAGGEAVRHWRQQAEFAAGRIVGLAGAGDRVAVHEAAAAAHEAAAAAHVEAWLVAAAGVDATDAMAEAAHAGAAAWSVTRLPTAWPPGSTRGAILRSRVAEEVREHLAAAAHQRSAARVAARRGCCL